MSKAAETTLQSYRNLTVRRSRPPTAAAELSTLGLMSHIVISTQDGISNTQLMHALGTCVPGGIGHIASSLRNGTPLFDGELFQGPRLEQFTRVRRLLAILQDFGVEPFVWESGHPISARILLNIMQASDDSAAEFERLSDLGHEA